MLRRLCFFFQLRIGSFFAKIIGKEPHVTWTALFREHFVEYPFHKIKGLVSKNNESNFFKITPYDDTLVVVTVGGLSVFWPMHFPTEPILSGYNAIFNNEADNYFRFYTPKKTDIVFDLGACEGIFSLLLRDKVEKVYTFEPFPGLCHALACTLEDDIKTGRAEICNYAVGDKIGEVDFFLDDDLDGSSMQESRLEGKETKKISVPMITLDDFIIERGIQRVSMIKMDVEGAEFDVLQGARGILSKMKPDLLVSSYHYPHDYERLSQFLVDLGYKIKTSPLVMTTQGGQSRPWYRYALVYATFPAE